MENYEVIRALDAKTTQAFLNRIYPYNQGEPLDVDPEALASELDISTCKAVGHTVLTETVVFADGKIPATESISEETQEMKIPVLPETTAVLVKTVRLGADPRLVPYGEPASKYPRGNRQHFFLAKVID